MATLSGTVSIDGNAVFDEVLTANTTLLTSTPTVTLGTLTYQWKRGTTNIGTNAATYTLAQADIGATITVTVTAANCDGEVTSAPTATVSKATQTAPAAPTLASKTATSITLNTIADCEYSMNSGTTWQAATTFGSLTPNMSYTFVARKTETATHLASPASSAASFTTDALPTYSINATVNNSEYGAISPAGESFIEEGGSITYTITPAANYKIDSVLVNGVDQGPITSYTFEDVQANATIHVVFVYDVGIKNNELANVQVYSYQNVVYIKNESNVVLKSVGIFDMTGRAIYRGDITDRETAITLQASYGIYHVVLTTQDNRTSSTKLLLKKQ